jgi:DNA-binding transcriptional regulator YiaG
MSVATKKPRKPAPSDRPPNPWPARLSVLRKRLGITQVAAAARLGIPTRTWIAWENGQRQPRGPSARLIELVFGK